MTRWIEAKRPLHPAWILALVIPVAPALAFNDRNARLGALLLFAVGCLLLALRPAWTAFTRITPPQLAKELRSHWLSALVTSAATLLALLWRPSDTLEISHMIFALGCAVLATETFGAEFSYQTIPTWIVLIFALLTLL